MVNYSELLNYIIDCDKKYVVISGICDIISTKYNSSMIFKEITNSNFWIRLGNTSDEYIVECLKDCDFDLDKEGEYYFDAILSWDSDIDEYGSRSRSYLEIQHIDWIFQQTFEARERESKLNKILDNDSSELFKFI